MTLGKRIASLRERRGLTKKQLGELLGYEGRSAEMRVHRIEHEEAELKVKDLVKLAKVFETDTNSILRGVDLD